VSVITALKPQKNRKRVNVYLDGKFAFGIDLENLMKFGLKVKQELEEREIEEIVKKANFQKTYNRLARFVTLRPRSKKEIEDWLKKKKIHKSLHNKLFNRLNRLGLVDDKKFARWWVEQRLNFRPRAKRILAYELRKKGVDKNIIEDVFSEVEIDEERIALKLLEKKKYKWKNLGKFERKKKMGEFLARHGFGWQVIKRIIDAFLGKD
jgi:regulatory protein